MREDEDETSGVSSVACGLGGRLYLSNTFVVEVMSICSRPTLCLAGDRRLTVRCGMNVKQILYKGACVFVNTLLVCEGRALALARGGVRHVWV